MINSLISKFGFEAYHLTIPKGCDKILGYLYGDYMKLPPAKSRVDNQHIMHG